MVFILVQGFKGGWGTRLKLKGFFRALIYFPIRPSSSLKIHNLPPLASAVRVILLKPAAMVYIYQGIYSAAYAFSTDRWREA